MEEKKTKQTKDGKDQKLTYEQLNEACSQLFQQNQYLTKQVRELSAYNAFKRLDYLFKVLELADVFNDAGFVGSCIDELKQALTMKEESDNDDSNTKS